MKRECAFSQCLISIFDSLNVVNFMNDQADCKSYFSFAYACTINLKCLTSSATWISRNVNHMAAMSLPYKDQHIIVLNCLLFFFLKVIINSL